MEPAGSGATWTGSPKGGFSGRKHHKSQLALNNITAGMREPSEWSGGPSDIEGKTTWVGASECGQRTSFNRTREAGNRDRVEGVVANTLKLYRQGAIGFIDWLDRFCMLLTANDKPADHAESNEKGNLAKGNLLKSIGKWLKKEE